MSICPRTTCVPWKLTPRAWDRKSPYPLSLFLSRRCDAAATFTHWWFKIKRRRKSWSNPFLLVSPLSFQPWDRPWEGLFPELLNSNCFCRTRNDFGSVRLASFAQVSPWKSSSKVTMAILTIFTQIFEASHGATFNSKLWWNLELIWIFMGEGFTGAVCFLFRY